MTTSTLAYEYGTGWVEAFVLPTDQDFLFSLLEDLFSNHWGHIVFGSLIQGAVFEARVTEPPKHISVFDGYLTVDFGHWHFHVCIGPHRGSPMSPATADLAAHRRTKRAEFFRVLNSDRQSARSWGLRLFNGNDEQQITIFFPNPFLSEDGNKVLKTPDWSRLSVWDSFRQRYLGLGPDAIDRSGKGLRCGGH